MVSEISSTTASSPYRLVSPRNSTDATPILLDVPRGSPADVVHAYSNTKWPIRIRDSLTPRLLAGERRLALLHEGAATLDEVLAGETGLHHLGAARDVALGFVLHDLADDVFDRLHGQRRVAGDGL